MRITVHDNPTAFLDLTQAPLMERESANGLLLGVALRMAQGLYDSRPAPYMATIGDGPDLLLAAVMTPPYPVLLFSPDGADHAGAMPALCDGLRRSGVQVPGVLAPSELADALAACWAEDPVAAVAWEAAQWVYELRSVDPEVIATPGRYRLAVESDLDILTGWFGEDSRRGLLSGVCAGRIGLWTNPHPVSVAGTTRFTGTGGAINRVYTPEEERSKGYATACVANLCQQMLDAGWRFCCLHADQANEPANRVYRKVGFVPVCAYGEYRFDRR